MKKILIILLFASAISLFAQDVSIYSIRENDFTGQPKLSGQTFTVKGVVTSSNHFGYSGPASIQDSSAGISIYGSSFSGAVNIGDSVIITASLTHYNGLTQLNAEVPIIISSGNEVEPEIVTLDQIANQDWDGVELFESKLVKINGVTITGSGYFAGDKNYTITDSTGTLELRIDKDVSTLVGSPIPSGEIDLIGVIQQYKYAAPYNSGYQILPRSIDDIVSDYIVLREIIISINK